MAYNKKSFVDFEHLKLKTFHGPYYDSVWPSIIQWIYENPGYKFVDINVDYIAPLNIGTKVCEPPATSYQLEVTIIYTEG